MVSELRLLVYTDTKASPEVSEKQTNLLWSLSVRNSRPEKATYRTLLSKHTHSKHQWTLDGQSGLSPIASVQRTQPTLTCHSAAPRRTNTKARNATVARLETEPMIMKQRYSFSTRAFSTSQKQLRVGATHCLSSSATSVSFTESLILYTSVCLRRSGRTLRMALHAPGAEETAAELNERQRRMPLSAPGAAEMQAELDETDPGRPQGVQMQQRSSRRRTSPAREHVPDPKR